MSRRVLVVGGYGAVGGLLCRALSADPGMELVLAGRRPERAPALPGAAVRRIDLEDSETWIAATDEIDLVVMCMDQSSTEFVRFLFERGIGYADITAEDDLFSRIEGLRPPERSSALLSVGLAPGLSNLMAAYAASRLDHAERVEIGLLFGLGDSHGQAGIEWTAGKVFERRRRHQSVILDFGSRWGRRRAYQVAFSDQEALRRTLALEARTSLALDSQLATAALFGLGRLFAGSRLVRRMAVAASLGPVRFGTEALSLLATAWGRINGRPAQATVRFHGAVESLTTARLAAMQLRAFFDNPPPRGVWHSHQVLDPATQFEAIAKAGIGTIEDASAET